jgi:PTS system galactitol-specific IIC component
MPIMIGILVEGLMPLSEAAREWVQKRFAGREVYLGLDAAVLMGEPSVLATGFLLVPYWILMSTVLPGNKVLPIASLSAPIWYTAFAVAWAGGNIVKAFISGLISLPIVLWTSTAIAPLLTQVARAIQYDLPAAGVGVTAVVTGAEPPALLIVQIIRALLRV